MQAALQLSNLTVQLLFWPTAFNFLGFQELLEVLAFMSSLRYLSFLVVLGLLIFFFKMFLYVGLWVHVRGGRYALFCFLAFYCSLAAHGSLRPDSLCQAEVSSFFHVFSTLVFLNLGTLLALAPVARLHLSRFLTGGPHIVCLGVLFLGTLWAGLGSTGWGWDLVEAAPLISFFIFFFCTHLSYNFRVTWSCVFLYLVLVHLVRVGACVTVHHVSTDNVALFTYLEKSRPGLVAFASQGACVLTVFGLLFFLSRMSVDPCLASVLPPQLKGWDKTRVFQQVLVCLALAMCYWAGGFTLIVSLLGFLFAPYSILVGYRLFFFKGYQTGLKDGILKHLLFFCFVLGVLILFCGTTDLSQQLIEIF